MRAGTASTPSFAVPTGRRSGSGSSGVIDPMHERAVAYRRRTGVDVYLGHARFVGPRVLEVDGEELRGEHVVVAAGSRPRIPPIPGLEAVAYDTSDTIMRVDPLPESMVVLGGGFVAAEMSHVFGSLGTAITIVHRGPTLLAHHDEDIQRSFTDRYRERFTLRPRLRRDAGRVDVAGIAVHVDGPDGRGRRGGASDCWSRSGGCRTATSSTSPPAASRSTTTGTSRPTTASPPTCPACGRSATWPTTSSSSTWPTRRSSS